jgi:HEAT repeat protein
LIALQAVYRASRRVTPCKTDRLFARRPLRGNAVAYDETSAGSTASARATCFGASNLARTTSAASPARSETNLPICSRVWIPSKGCGSERKSKNALPIFAFTAAVIALAETANRQAVPHLAREIADAAPEVRQQAARALGEFDGIDVAGALVRAVADADKEVAGAAAESLALLRDPDASGPLLARVGHESAVVRAAMFRGPKAPQVETSLVPAIAALTDPDEAVRVQSVGVIGYLRRGETLSALIGASHDPSAEVRLAAVSALSFARGDASAANAAAAALQDSSWQVRLAACRTLQGGGRAVGGMLT